MSQVKRKLPKKRRNTFVRQPTKAVPSFIRLYLQHLVHEGVLIFALAAAAFMLLALLSYHHEDPGWSHVSSLTVLNATGRVGAWLADFFLCIFGYAAYVFPVLLGYGAWQAYCFSEQTEVTPYHRFLVCVFRVAGFLMVLLMACALIAAYFPRAFSPLPYTTGGMLGAVIKDGLITHFNFWGATVVMLSLLFLGVTLFADFSWLKCLERCGAMCIDGLRYMQRYIKTRYKAAFKPLQARPVRVAVVGRTPSPDRVLERVADRVPDRVSNRVSESAPIAAAVPSSARLNLPLNLPSLDLLDSPPVVQRTTILDQQKLEAKSAEVEQRLCDFGIQTRVVAVHPGPVVTRYELELAAGTKVSRISALAKDLARSLSVMSVRVVEVIPGKSVIGLELPNEQRETVVLQEIVASKAYQNSRSALTLALGKDIAGHSVVVDLAKMPHLLVAGTTGSGKSVCLNAMLLSLIYKSSPEHLRLILIDPKMLELSVYDGIPHLLAPVVTDMKDAATALRWCVVEMERRYRVMASLGVRNIAGYNEKIKEGKKQGKVFYDPLTVNQPVENRIELESLPQIVVLADEFADMMVVVGKKVETLIARLAQKARAAGIHLILATQRPSVDVITGLIKANIPTRIAFQVSSKIDSRTILDQQGAEQLLGHGDMLYLPPGSGVPIRVHGAYVHDEEVHRVVQAVKQSGPPQYVEHIFDQASVGVDSSGYTQAAWGEPGEEQEGGGGSDTHGEKDALYDQAVEMVVQARRVSVSSIQRRFKIGYNRAARMVDAMEAAGVVSPMETNGNREVLVPPHRDTE